jgi:hypothetical protein
MIINYFIYMFKFVCCSVFRHILQNYYHTTKVNASRNLRMYD